MKWLRHLLNFHECYYGVPHKRADGCLVQTCYDCSRDRPVQVKLIPSLFAEGGDLTMK